MMRLVVMAAIWTAGLLLRRPAPRDRKRGLRIGGMHVDIDKEDCERLEGKVTVAKTGSTSGRACPRRSRSPAA
jgi:hypothetical protein